MGNRSSVGSRAPRPVPLRTLWAPWRGRYLRQLGPRRCLFCVAKRPRDDRKHYVIYRGKMVFVILNLYPYNNGHLMIAPYRHVGTLDRVREGEAVELLRVTSRMERLLTRAIRPHGFNVGLNVGRAAGAGIPGHLHVHVVPRWIGDTNFMPVLGHAKVISQSLDELYRHLRRLQERT